MPSLFDVLGQDHKEVKRMLAELEKGPIAAAVASDGGSQGGQARGGGGRPAPGRGHPAVTEPGTSEGRPGTVPAARPATP